MCANQCTRTHINTHVYKCHFPQPYSFAPATLPTAAQPSLHDLQSHAHTRMRPHCRAQVTLTRARALAVARRSRLLAGLLKRSPRSPSSMPGQPQQKMLLQASAQLQSSRRVQQGRQLGGHRWRLASPRRPPRPNRSSCAAQRWRLPHRQGLALHTLELPVKTGGSWGQAIEHPILQRSALCPVALSLSARRCLAPLCIPLSMKGGSVSLHQAGLLLTPDRPASHPPTLAQAQPWNALQAALKSSLPAHAIFVGARQARAPAGASTSMLGGVPNVEDGMEWMEEQQRALQGRAGKFAAWAWTKTSFDACAWLHC